MKKTTLILVAGSFVAVTACKSSQTDTAKQTVITETAVAETPAPAAAPELDYPETKKVEQVDEYHGTSVRDPYRWLETHTEEVDQWIQAQNKVTFNYLEQIPFREQIRERLTQIWNFPKYSAPVKKGNNYYFYKNDGLQNQSVLYVQKSLEAEPEVFLDPNKFSEDGTTSLTTLSFSNDNKYVAYGTSGGGSDWNTFYVMDVNNRKQLSDKLEWIKFSGASWFKDGFFYSRYDAPTDGNKLAKKNEFHKVYYHKVGTPQSQDKLIYEDKTKPLRNFYVQTTDDERYLVMNMTEGAGSANALYYKDLKDPKSTIKPIIDNFESDNNVVDNIGDKLLVRTNKNAPRYRLVLIDPKKPQEQNWKVVVPESQNVLTGVSHVGGRLIASYMKDATSEVVVYDINGKQLNRVELPTIGTVGGFSGKKDDKETFFTFTSFVYPTTIYKYTVADNKVELFRKTEVDINPDNFETKQVFYTSKDGTKVPMFIVHKKGLKLDGNNPTYLYAYGGFNISLTPSFSVTNLLWLENGGVYAMPNLRGGGEYGESWHKAGMTPNKQNVFDDFIAAGEYLVKEGYTNSDKLAISGRSNGGLLVGATMTQRPDLAKVALPGVGVLDMLRFHKFTIGWAWVPEYGSSDNPAQFENLYKFSPLHNIKEGVKYPATMVTTADHDDRVVPAHSFKFISTLQEKGAPGNPYLIRVDVKAGHGAGKPTSLQIQEWADIWSFVYYNMGVNPYDSKQ
ncbi:MAG: prolyl oligopeptidase family serine peptidase [Hymenobacteraceae bacterium]|nr:prolyl oligopeptidase family serine peptidase [Hymenobacteraceae bacterium]MDX5395032.1 prolyl oligopeptidase family serine peptidase [Hymenobacteraceae bacterium]MDX5443512.1 prolyl oligopeptidase family serine peptidase [Hymenobacteraceae bacterium]MDX5511066.1 prolyl oligopeptidase family serine peptidase [Hymenobacteraceae bacterium]